MPKLQESFFTPEQNALAGKMLEGTPLEDAGLAGGPETVGKVFEFRAQNDPSYQDEKGRSIVGSDEAKKAGEWSKRMGYDDAEMKIL